MNLFDVLFAKKLAGGGDYPAIIKRITGNPLVFSDGEDAPLIECKVEIEASQDLHGYDKPWVGGAGKNLVDESTLDMRDVTGESVYRAGLAPVELAPGDYTISYASKSESLGLYITIVDDNYSSTQITQSPITFTLSATKNVMIRSSAGAVSAWDVVDLMLEAGTVATSYEPYSNICPISGMSEVRIAGMDYNLLNNASWIYGKYVDYAGNIASNVNLKYTDNYIEVESESTYYVKAKKTIVDDYSIVVSYYSSSKAFLSREVIVGGAGAIELNGNFTTPTNAAYVRFNYPISNEYEYASETPVVQYTIDLDGARYGGVLDAVRGVLRLTHGFSTIDGTNEVITFVSSVTRCAQCEWGAYRGIGIENAVFKSDKFVYKTYSNEYTVYPSSGAPRCYFGLPKTVTSVADANAWFAENPTEICYPLATPQEITLSLTALRSLSGDNYIATDAKSLDVTYITDGYQEFVETIESNFGTRKGGLKPIDVFRMLEPKDKEETEEQEEKKEEAKK